MSAATIHDWTESQVLLSFGQQRDVKYRVYRNGEKHFQERIELHREAIADGSVRFSIRKAGS